MKAIQTFLVRHLAFTLLFVVGLVLWFAGTATIGEHYATAVGPDFLLKLPVALVKLAVILWVSRWFLRDRFPTIDAFTRKGDKEVSDFQKIWDRPLQNNHDPRLYISVIVHLLVPLIVSLVVLFAL